MKKILPFLILTLALQNLGAQDFGIAVQDDTASLLTNPAAIGVGNAGGISYLNRWTAEDGFEKDFDLLAAAGPFAYGFSRYYEQDGHIIAAGFPMGMGSYGGIHYRWQEDADDAGGWGLSYLVRPTPFLSLAAKGMDLNNDAYAEFGVGVRPLFFNKDWTSRLTLSGDARLQDGEWENLSAGAFLEPQDGIKIFGDYNFQEEAVEIGAKISFSYLDVGGTLLASGDEQGDRGSFSLHGSFKKQRSVLEATLNKAVEYDMAAVITDSPMSGFAFFEEESRSLLDFIMDMERIEKDRHVKAVIFRNQEFRTNFANLLEIEALLLKLKESGKKIYFYYDSIDNLPYSLAASVADGIYLNPAGSVYLRGFALTNFYLKDFFADWGVEVHNFRSHDYKSAYNSFSESGMTDAERESLQYLYDGLHAEMIRMIERGRFGKLSGTAQDAVDRGPYIYAKKALELGLVDQLLYEDEFDELLKEEKLNTFKASSSSGDISYDWENASQPVIALIHASGNIHEGSGMAGSSIGSDSMARAIRAARNNPLVRGIILRVNSGGGSALASDIIAREIALCKEGPRPKPVIVSMGGSAASGGYYISAAADKILATGGTVTGSIGVITVMPEITGLLEKFKISTDTVATSEAGYDANPALPMDEEEAARIREYIADNYERFVSFVAVSRDMEYADVHDVARGRIWTGTQAIERGLVDENGGLYDALVLMRDKIGSSQTPRLLEMVPGKNPGFIERNLTLPFSSRAMAGEMLPEDLMNLMKMYERLAAYEEGESLYMIPYTEEELGTAAYR